MKRLAFLLLAGLAGCGPKVKPAPAPVRSPTRSINFQIAVPAAFAATKAAFLSQPLALDLDSPSGGVLRSAWDERRIRFRAEVSPGLCLVRAERERGALDDAALDSFTRLADSIQAQLAAAAATNPVIAPVTEPVASTPFAKALKAIEKSGLSVEASTESIGRIETSWRMSEEGIALLDRGTNEPNRIYYRVRYIVQVSGSSASVRVEVEKSMDMRSWSARMKTTKKEEETLEKLRHALREELGA